MDGKVMYLLLGNVLLFAAGAAGVGAAIAVLYRARIPRWWAYVMSKAGLMATNLILLYRLFPSETVPVEPVAVAYTTFMLVTGIGVFGVAGDLARRGGKLQAQKHVQEFEKATAHKRVSDLEHRVDVEEARNTDIEQLARDHKEGTGDHSHEST